HQPDGSLLLTPAFKTSHPAIQSRLLKHWLVEIQKISSVGVHEIEGALAMLQPGGPAKVNLSGSRYLRRKAKRLWVE
ncbi:MAG TPA: TilS substrate-binding domain-containing protein, partial [Candidatus Saccharimonadia bacterium]|nr:TilS substrate-binding domain-containing protein [Candidatus Saccharimonadia bacterium]